MTVWNGKVYHGQKYPYTDQYLDRNGEAKSLVSKVEKKTFIHD